MTEPSQRPPALVVSVALGVVGGMLFIVGALFSRDALFVAGATAGAASLGAALYWRSELITAWKEDRRGRPPPSR